MSANVICFHFYSIVFQPVSVSLSHSLLFDPVFSWFDLVWHFIRIYFSFSTCCNIFFKQIFWNQWSELSSLRIVILVHLLLTLFTSFSSLLVGLICLLLFQLIPLQFAVQDGFIQEKNQSPHPFISRAFPTFPIRWQTRRHYVTHKYANFEIHTSFYSAA